MHTRIERIKNHIRENKKVYIGTTVGVVVGIVVGVYTLRKLVNNGTVWIAHPYDADNSTTNNIDANKVWFTQNTNYLQIGGRDGTVGRPGIPVRDAKTGNVYRSIKDASEHTGINRGEISNSMNDMIPVKGHQFEHVSIEAWNPDFNMDKLYEKLNIGDQYWEQ